MSTGGWKMKDLPVGFSAAWRSNNPDVDPPRGYQHPNGLTALIGREPYAEGDWRWHLSVRYGDPGTNGRVPSWDELVNAAHELRPGVPFVIGIPPRSWWMSVHPHVLHLVETKDEPMIEQWKANARGDDPS